MSKNPRTPSPSDHQPTGDQSELRKLRLEVESLRARVSEQAKEIRRVDELAETDQLTGISNRRSFENEIKRRFCEQERDGRSFCLLIIDVDGFKQINDQFGHAEGDRLLKHIATVVRSNVRQSDIVSRIGGDEFSIIMPGSTLEESEHAAQRLVQRTVKMIQADMGDIPVGLSIGLAESANAEEINLLIEAADRAMYRAKKAGGNRYKKESDE